MMTGSDRPEPCLAFPAGLHFTDVEPEVLAQEAAAEPPVESLPWPVYLRRTLDRQPGMGEA